MTHNFRSIGEGSHDSLSPVPTTDWRLDGHRHLCGLCQALPDVSADPTATGGGPMTRCPQCAFLVPQLAGAVCTVCAVQAPVQHIQRDLQTPWRIEHTMRTLFPPKPPAQARPIFVQPTPTPEARSPQPCEIPGCGGVAQLTKKGLAQMRTKNRPVRCPTCLARHRGATMHAAKVRLRHQREGG